MLELRCGGGAGGADRGGGWGGGIGLACGTLAGEAGVAAVGSASPLVEVTLAEGPCVPRRGTGGGGGFFFGGSCVASIRPFRFAVSKNPRMKSVLASTRALGIP